MINGLVWTVWIAKFAFHFSTTVDILPVNGAQWSAQGGYTMHTLSYCYSVITPKRDY